MFSLQPETVIPIGGCGSGAANSATCGINGEDYQNRYAQWYHYYDIEMNHAASPGTGPSMVELHWASESAGRGNQYPLCGEGGGYCYDNGDIIHGLDQTWFGQHRGLLATAGATVVCLVPVLGYATCGLAQAGAATVRMEQRGWNHYKANVFDLAVSSVLFGLGSAPQADEDAAVGYTAKQILAAKELLAALTDFSQKLACLKTPKPKTGS
jgi:hypothetical protein